MKVLPKMEIDVEEEYVLALHIVFHKHLASIKKLKIKESTIRGAGKGLFAWDPKKQWYIVFKRPRSTRLNNTPGQKIGMNIQVN